MADPDFHGHVCESCGTSFSHHKSRIPRGRGHQAHVCPGCERPVNLRVELSADEPVQFVEWYGFPEVNDGESTNVFGF